MNRSDNINDLAAALAKAQGAFKNPSRNREVTVRMKAEKGGGSYKFSYATFDEIINCVRKPLADNGLSFSQGLNGQAVVTMLMHASGQWLSTELPVKIGGGDNAAQAMGSGITYAKRYALTAMLGIASEEDDDGNAADGHVIDQSRDRYSNGHRPPPPPANGKPPNGTGSKPPNGNGHKPGNIDPDTRSGAAAMWAEQALDKLRQTARSHADVTGWRKMNAKTLAKLEAEHPPIHDKLMLDLDEFSRSLPSTLEAA